MLRYVNYDIVFQEIPNEITLAINISNCPNRCTGCHSSYLMEDTGEVLNEQMLVGLLEKYANAITCFCFMGGDGSPCEIEQFCAFLKQQTQGQIKTGWYSGKSTLPQGCSLQHFDYIKLGPYIERLGGLNSPTTNQRFYHIRNGVMTDRTDRFRRPSNCCRQ